MMVPLFIDKYMKINISDGERYCECWSRQAAHDGLLTIHILTALHLLAAYICGHP